jgi:hypothetical protein
VRHRDHAASNNANTSDDDSDNINNNTMDVNRGDGAVPGSDDDDDDRLSAHADETRVHKVVQLSLTSSPSSPNVIGRDP